MHDSNDDDIDRAYRAAAEVSRDDAAVQRRRSSVLNAVAQANAAVQLPSAGAGNARQAANQHHWHSPALWRGAAAASIIGASALLVVHLGEEPGVAMAPVERANAERAASAAAPLPTPRFEVTESRGTTTNAKDEAAAPHRATAVPARATAGNAAPRTTAAVPAVEPRQTPSPTAQAAPEAEAVRSAFPGDGAQQALRSEPVELAQRESPAADAAAAPGRSRAAESALGPIRPAPAAGRQAVDAKAAPLGSNAPRLADATAQGNLLAAARSGDIVAARRILQTTAPDAERDAEGRTALALAVLRSDVALVRLLLERGADPLTPDHRGQTPLGYAEAQGHPALLQAFGSR